MAKCTQSGKSWGDFDPEWRQSPRQDTRSRRVYSNNTSTKRKKKRLFRKSELSF